MKRDVKKKLWLTHYQAAMYENGELHTVKGVLIGKFSQSRAQKAIQALLDNKNITVNNLSYQEQIYSMPIEEFINHATLVKE